MTRQLNKPTFIALLGAGIVLIALATYGLIHFLVVRYSGPDRPGEAVVISTDAPSERALSVENEYTVPDDRPRRLIIDTIGVDSYIQRVGITGNGAMAAPNNIFLTGWYVHGVVPGDKGLAVINGHEGGRYNDGVFKKLGEVQKTDSIVVEMGDRSLRLFMVERVDTYAVEDATAELFNDDPVIERELRLITCEGTYDPLKRTYDQRTIVVASRVDGPE